jgi:putative ABC transport system permease protein
VAGVSSAESWAVFNAYRLSNDARESSSLQLVAPPGGSELVRPVLISGRWLVAGDARDVVVNTDVLHQEPDLGVGSALALRIGPLSTSWHVVGVVRGILGGPIVYTTREALWAATRSTGLVNRLAVVSGAHSAAAEADLAHRLSDRFEAAGVAVNGIDTTTEWRDFQAADYGIAINFLIAMAVMLALIGGLSLMGMMSINVIERTREIGVMRAIGAGTWALRKIIVAEALVVGAVAWLLALPLSLPASRVLSDAFGNAFIHTPLSFEFSLLGLLLWLLLCLALAAAASLLPAWSASRLTVRQAISYE